MHFFVLLAVKVELHQRVTTGVGFGAGPEADQAFPVER